LLAIEQPHLSAGLTKNFSPQGTKYLTLETESISAVIMAKEKVGFKLNDPAAVKQEMNELISSTGLPCVLWRSRYQLYLYV
jgi:hypothetical protein